MGMDKIKKGRTNDMICGDCIQYIFLCAQAPQESMLKSAKTDCGKSPKKQKERLGWSILALFQVHFCVNTCRIWSLGSLPTLLLLGPSPCKAGPQERNMRRNTVNSLLFIRSQPDFLLSPCHSGRSEGFHKTCRCCSSFILYLTLVVALN